MIDEKTQSDGLPEPIDIKDDVPPEVSKISKKSNKKNEPVVPKKETLEELIEKNIKWSKAIYSQNKKIKSRLNMMAFLSYLKIFLIIAPIILAIVYLPSLIGQYKPQIDNFFGENKDGSNFGSMLLESFGLENIISELTPEQIQQMQGALKK